MPTTKHSKRHAAAIAANAGTNVHHFLMLATVMASEAMINAAVLQARRAWRAARHAA